MGNLIPSILISPNWNNKKSGIAAPASPSLPPPTSVRSGRSVRKIVGNAEVSALKSHVVVTDPRFHPEKFREIRPKQKNKSHPGFRRKPGLKHPSVFGQSFFSWWVNESRVLGETFVAQEPSSSSSSSSSSSRIYILSSCSGSHGFKIQRQRDETVRLPNQDPWGWYIDRSNGGFVLMVH